MEAKKYISPVQAQNVSYDLHSLGWKSFQDLCVTIISEVLGQTVQVFLPSKDGGRDGAFHGSWDPTHGAGLKGSFTVQCKFTSKKNKALSLGELSDELEKAHRLAARGLSDNYIIMTNCQVSGVADEQIRDAFLKCKGLEQFLILGSDWITSKIRESSRLRMLVPRVYGLGDLSQILDGRAYEQAEEILRSMGEDLAKFVITDAHNKSAKALIEYGFVLLLGAPAAGKSTIAASLALGAIDIWGCSTLKVVNSEEFLRHWNPHEPRQFFWVDDAFGTTQYQKDMVNSWNRAFPAMQAAIKKGARVLFTSRDYIYNAARSDLKGHAFPLLNESQVVINVQKLTKSEKEQILYNHIKLGNQKKEFRKAIKPYLSKVAASNYFLPEIARRLGNSIFTKNLAISEHGILEFVESPLSFLIDVVRSLDCDCRAALSLIFMGGGSLESPIEFSKERAGTLALLGGTTSRVRESLSAMEGSLVKLVSSEGNFYWNYKHPTVRDAFASIIAEDPELLDIYLNGTHIDKLLIEVTCGDVGIEGVKVIIPQNRYGALIRRMEQIDHKNQRYFYIFLAYRCDREFLIQYIRKYPDLYKEIVSIYSYLGVISKVDLILRLHQFTLLPEEWRLKFVERVEHLAISTPDADFLHYQRIRAIFKNYEIKKILKSIRNDLLPHLSSYIEEWEDNYDSSEDPEEYFEPLKEALSTFRKEFKRDKEAINLIDKALVNIDMSIEYLLERDSHEEPDYEGHDYSSQESRQPGESRSIFDDVDQ